MLRAVLALAFAVVAAALPGAAHAQVANGQLAVLLRDRIATVNPDGTGLRSLYVPPYGEITSLTWSPDGNKLAIIWDGNVVVVDVATRKAEQLTDPPPGQYDADPAWMTNGESIGFRRGQTRYRVSASGSTAALGALDEPADAFAYAAGLNRWAYRTGSHLYLSTRAEFELRGTAAGPLAFSRKGSALAYVDDGTSPAYPGGLTIIDEVWGTARHTWVAPPPVAAVRWAPDDAQLVFVRDEGLHIVAAQEAATPVAVPGVTGAVAVDWQPCTGETTVGCRSLLAPTCSTSSVRVTTPADVPVELAPAPCADPAGLPLRLEIDRPGVHGTVSGTVYTPRPGFTGQDTLSYRVSNGTAQSDPVRVTIFVVPRSLAAAPPPSAGTFAGTAAPFLGLRRKPALSRKRSTLARLSCDRACTFTVRLQGTLRGRREPVKGRRVERTLAAGRVLALRLRLPAKPKGRLKTVFITGTVRGETGAARPVKLPVTVRR